MMPFAGYFKELDAQHDADVTSVRYRIISTRMLY